MNEYHVIDIANSLEELEQDYNDWSRMPYDLRRHSDDYCIQKYGMTNTQLYNAQRANFIYYSDTKWKLQQEIAKIRISDNDGSLISKNINDLPFGCTSSGEVSVQAEKILASNRVRAMDDEFIVIPDWLNDDSPDYSMEDLVKMYNDYLNVPQDHKNISNSYSIKIWNKSVPDMYIYMKSKFQKVQSDSMEDPITVEESVSIPSFTPDVSDQALNNFRNTILSEAGDDLQVLVRKLDCYKGHKNISKYESAILESYGDKIHIGKKSYRVDMPGVVPFLQYDEYVNNPEGLDTRKICGGMFPYILSYAGKEKETYEKLKEAYRNHDTKTLLEMGWNPVVKPTAESLKEARERQIEYLDKLYPITIVNVSEYTTSLSDDVLSEALETVPSSKQLHPIFLVLGASKSETIFSKFSDKLFSDQEYSNVGVSFDSSMQTIFTFEEVSKGNLNRMRVDSIEDYKYRTGKVRIIAFFVSKEIFDKLKNSMKNYMTLQDNSPYTFDNTFALLANLPKLKHRSMAILCASFLDAMYTIANVHDKLSGMKNKNATIHFYILYTGTTTTYRSKEIDKKVKTLQKNLGFKELNFFEPDLILGDTQYKFFEAFDIKSTDSRIDNVLKEIRKLLTPTDCGCLLEDVDLNNEILNHQLTDCINLLATYGENEVEGMKHEVAHLMFMVSKHHKDNTISNENKLLLDRAKENIMLYSRIIKNIQPEFDLFEYIKGTPYGEQIVKVDRNIFKYDSANLT